MQTIIKEEEFQCVICGQLPEKAHSSSCCGSVYCSTCLKNLLAQSHKKCPYCRNQNPDYQVNAFLIKLINKFPSECKYKCGFKSQVSEVRQHQLTCEEKIYHCNSCDFQDSKQKFLDHTLEKHSSKIIQIFDTNAPQDKSDKFQSINPLSQIKNSEGRVCFIGTTSKFYCGTSADHQCDQCDGQCGPLNGCNCSSCMQLDVLYRNLDKNMLVNLEGRISTLKNDKFACGLLLDGETKCGQQFYCLACQVLSDHMEYYSSALK